jgi:hypothetical protein
LGCTIKKKKRTLARKEKNNTVDCHKMGVCQSRSERGYRFHIDIGALPAAKDRNYPLAQSIKKSTPGGGGNSYTSFAYDLALVSPSEKTDVTDALSPTSMYSPPLSDIPNKKKNHFVFVVDVDDENDSLPSDEEFGDLRPNKIVGGTFPEPERRENRNEKKDSVNDEDNNDLNKHHFFELLTTREEEFIRHDQMMQNEFHDRWNLSSPMGKLFVDANYCNTMDNHSRGPNIPPNTNQILETPIQSMIQSSRGADVKDVSSDTKSGNCDHFRSHQLNSKPDPPPLLAPPKDVTLVTCPSNTETSIKPAIIAAFNKIKTQVKQAHKQEKQRRQEEKIQDRRRDIEGYKELWGEYNEIKERVIKQREKNAESPSLKKGEKKISLNDLTTWYVDFSALNSMNHLDHKVAVDYLETADNKDRKNQTSLPLLIESTFDSTNNIFQQEEFQQRKTPGAHSTGSNASSPRHSGIRESTAPPQNDHDGDTSENGRNIDTLPSATMDLDSENRSIISELDNGSNSSMTLDTGKAFDNDDYGVLHRYSRKSIESTVPTHTEDFNAQLGNMGLHNHDANTFLSATKSRNENSATPSSFSTYLAKNCLPSVFIDNAETGLIRWRESPEKDTEIEEARKIDFSHYENKSMKKETGVSDIPFSQAVCESRIHYDECGNNGDSNAPLQSQIQNDLIEVSEIESIPTSTSAAAIQNNMGNFDEGLQSDKENESHADRIQLIRKVGPQINDLLAQLQNNGLVE